MLKLVTPDSPRQYTAADASDVSRNVAEARAICRAVSLALAAQIDRAVSFGERSNDAARWHSAIEAACERVAAVRDVLIEAAQAPASVDWYTPLNLLEASGAALWHCGSAAPAEESISLEELAACMNAVIRSLDDLAKDVDQAAGAHAAQE